MPVIKGLLDDRGHFTEVVTSSGAMSSAETSSGNSGRGVVFDLNDLRQEADQIRAAAEQEAAEIIRAARRTAEAEATAIADRAERDGFAKGEADGREAGRLAAETEVRKSEHERIEHLIRVWTAAVSRVQTTRLSLVESAGEDLVQLAIRIAERLVHQAIEADPEIVIRQTRRAVAMVMNPHRVSVRAHPDDVSILESITPEIMASVAACEAIDVAGDETVARGGVVVQSGDGQVDARIATQIDRIATSLLTGVVDDSDYDDDDDAHDVTASMDNEDDSDVSDPIDG